MKTILAGYSVEIETWENDYDHVKTETYDGLSKVDAMYFIALCKLFKSENSDLSGFGNSNANYHAIFDKVKEIPIPEGVSYDLIYDTADEFHDGFVCDVIGFAYESEYYRVFESAQVFYFPEEINADDVTGEFN